MKSDRNSQHLSDLETPICIGVRQLAARLNISVSGVYLNAIHLPPYFKLNGRRMYLLSEIKKWERAMAEQPRTSTLDPRN